MALCYLDAALSLALAYAGGLVLSAPFALAALWITGVELAATVCLGIGMATVFIALRRTASQAPAAPTATAAHQRPVPQAVPGRVA